MLQSVESVGLLQQIEATPVDYQDLLESKTFRSTELKQEPTETA